MTQGRPLVTVGDGCYGSFISCPATQNFVRRGVAIDPGVSWETALAGLRDK